MIADPSDDRSKHLSTFYGVCDGAGLVRALAPYSAEERAAHFLLAAVAPLTYSRHHWLLYKGKYHVREELRAEFDRLSALDPSMWDPIESDFMLCLFCLSTADIGLDDLNEFLSLTALEAALQDRRQLLTAAVRADDRGEDVSTCPDSWDGLVDLAVTVRALRTSVLERFYVYSDIDGQRWYRVERILPRASVDLVSLPAPVAASLRDFGVNPAAGFESALTQATANCVRAHECSLPLLRSIMSAALEDPTLRGDHVTITCASGESLQDPLSMSTNEAFFTETVLRPGIDLTELQEQIGHDDEERLKSTVRARMLKLKRGAVRAFYGEGCLHGRFVEKNGGYMIFRNEDAHYRGHQSVGCSTGGRAPYSLRFELDGEGRELPPMVGDFRVVRASHDVADLFTGDDLAKLIPYAECLRAVLQKTFTLGSQVRPQAQRDAGLGRVSSGSASTKEALSAYMD